MGLMIIKRNGQEVPFDTVKIEIAVRKAMFSDGLESNQSLPSDVANIVKDQIKEGSKVYSVEDIQDKVIETLKTLGYEKLASGYAEYRNEKTIEREVSLHKEVRDLITLNNNENENANKDTTVLHTQRDGMAGALSKDIARNEMIPRHLVKAHDEGIIHIHDMDYLAQYMTNCCLVNLDDMLTNGTKLNGKLIETPKSLRTASTVMTQVVAGVAGAQYGGQTISLAHISPYIDVSRKKHREEIIEEYSLNGIDLIEENIDRTVAIRLSKEIKDSVQTIQYQLETLSTTNGRLAA